MLRQFTRKKNLLYLILGFLPPLLLVISSIKFVETSAISDYSEKIKDYINENTKNLRHDTLEKVVKGELREKNVEYGVVVKNLDSGELYQLNEHNTFSSGSLYKLWVMATTYNMISLGKINENEMISQSISYLNNEFNISYPYAERYSGSISLPVTDALEQMITVSDNYSALLLSDKVKNTTIAEYLAEKGLKESVITTTDGYPKTTASDIALFFEKLYRGQLGDDKSTEQMLTLLSRQQKNNKLPKYLKDDVVIAHKTGEIDGFSHDAGIVYTPKGNYLIVVLTHSSNPQKADDSIGKISKAVYEYITR